MPIVKFCSRSHNPFHSDTTIQVCTLYHYKSVDNDFLRDADEGLTSRTFHTPTPTVVTGDDIGRMTGLSIGGSGTIHLSGRAVQTTNPIPNAYVFCTSSMENPTEQHAASLGYDSWYVVANADRFASILAHELMRQIASQKNVLYFHGPVSYQSEKRVEYAALPEFITSHRAVEPSHYFLKRNTSRQDQEKCFANELEYRFVFLPVADGNRPMPIKQDKVYVASQVVLDTIAAGSV